MTDLAGTLTGTADYDTFGAVRTSTGTGSVFGFTGEQFDAETGYTYLRARYLNPTAGRFTSADTVQPNAPGTQGYNLYAYVANNPTTWVDPSGHSVEGDAYLTALAIKNPVWIVGLVGPCARSGLWFGVCSTTIMRMVTIPILICAMTPACFLIAEFYAAVLDNGSDFPIPGETSIPTDVPADPPPPPPPPPDCLGDSPLEIARVLTRATQGKGNFGLGRASARVADLIGKTWVGPGATLSSDGVAWVSQNRLRQYRPPTLKGDGATRANIEWRAQGGGNWQSDGHIDIDERCP